MQELIRSDGQDQGGEKMPSFDEEFMKAQGIPIKYNNWELIRINRIPVQKIFSGYLKIISTNSEWKQAVCFNVNGKLIVPSPLGEPIEGKKFIIWADDLGDEILPFKGTSKDLQFTVYNAWEDISRAKFTEQTGQRYSDSWLGGAAMIVEVDGNTRRYRCNDGHPDDNFDDIVFEITIDE